MPFRCGVSAVPRRRKRFAATDPALETPGYDQSSLPGRIQLAGFTLLASRDRAVVHSHSFRPHLQYRDASFVYMGG